MAGDNKTFAVMRANPRDWRIASLESVAVATGAHVRKSDGSHVVFEHHTEQDALTVPVRRSTGAICIQPCVRFIDAVRGVNDSDEYRFTMRPLTSDEGGGYLIGLPGCMSEEETIEQAVANGADAKDTWIAAMREAGRTVPPPTADAAETYSGKWVVTGAKIAAPWSGGARAAGRCQPERAGRFHASEWFGTKNVTRRLTGSIASIDV